MIGIDTSEMMMSKAPGFMARMASASSPFSASSTS